MTVTAKDILKESFYIDMSLSNLGLYNESITDMAAGAISAVVRMIENFINWVRSTIIPFLKKIAKAIANLIRKTKIGRKILGDPKSNDKEVEDPKPVPEKRAVLQTPKWLNKIAHSYINPNAIMKLANSTEDRTGDIQQIETAIDESIKAGEVTKVVEGSSALDEAKTQLKIMEDAVIAFENNCNEIIKRCEDLKRKIAGSTNNGDAVRAKNTSAIIQMVTRKMSQAMKVSSENLLRLKMVIEPK